MRRREFIILLGSAAAAWPPHPYAIAQQSAKVWRIGMLEVTPRLANAANVDAFRRALQELGYIEGRNLVLEVRLANGRLDQLPALAAELVKMRVDVVAAVSAPAIHAAALRLNSRLRILTHFTLPITPQHGLAAIAPPRHTPGIDHLAFDMKARDQEPVALVLEVLE